MGNLNDHRTYPQYWCNKAEQLDAAAAALELVRTKRLVPSDESEALPDYGAREDIIRMLCGSALEAIYKAILMAEGKKPPATHDLSPLAGMARLTLKPKEKKALQLLTQCVIWDGRYPCPLPKADDAWDEIQKLEEQVAYRLEKTESKSLLGGLLVQDWGWAEYHQMLVDARRHLYTLPGVHYPPNLPKSKPERDDWPDYPEPQYEPPEPPEYEPPEPDHY